MSLKELLQEYQSCTHAALERWLPDEDIQPEHLHAAMRYSVLSDGKRIRPVLVYTTGVALGVERGVLDAPASAVELIHAYSLIHDDLPAMDDDDLRRGRPTCHKAFDEATAILAGDAIQALAFQVLAQHCHPAIGADQRIRMIENLALASGSRGMAGGQAIDLASVGKQLNIVELENMHIHKTGALIRSSVQLGALASHEVDQQVLDKLDHYAKCIGLAFQVQDDILDVEGDTEIIGKPQGSDIESNKPTYPNLLGLEGAKQAARDLHQEAINSLDVLGEAGEPLRWIADYIVQRNR